MTSLACPSSLMCSGRPGRRRSLQRNRELNPRKQVRNREEVASEQGSVEAPSSRRVEPGATRRSDARGAIVASRSKSEEHTSELQSLMRISYAVFCLRKTKIKEKY